MSHIDDLIAETAPGGVDSKLLGEVGEFIRGNGLQKSALTDSGFPAIHYGQIHTHYGTSTEITKSFTDPDLAAKLRRARPGDLIVVTTSEDDEAVAKATAWLGEGEVAVSGDAYIFRHSLDPLYAAYFFQTRSFQTQKQRHITGTKVRRVSGDSLSKIRIPVPPLEVQREIARVLEQLSKLGAELEIELRAELTERRRQYNHFRSALLTFEDGDERVRRVPLGEVGDLVRGSGMPKTSFTESGVGAIHYGQIYTHFGTSAEETIAFVAPETAARLKKVDPGDIIITNTSENLEDVGKAVAWLGEEQIVTGGHATIFKHDQDPRFIAHWFQSPSFQAQKKRLATGTKVMDVSAKQLATVEIPLPPIELQREIVEIVERFYELDAELEVELRAELQERKRQFEYHRDALLACDEAVQ